jgi:hypothetical protein
MNLSTQELKFYEQWKIAREKGKFAPSTFYKGMFFGFILGISILLCLYSGWYQRAEMMASTRMSTVTMTIIILILGLFTGFIYCYFVWELNEQRFEEITIKKNIKN